MYTQTHTGVRTAQSRSKSQPQRIVMSTSVVVVLTRAGVARADGCALETEVSGGTRAALVVNVPRPSAVVP